MLRTAKVSLTILLVFIIQVTVLPDLMPWMIRLDLLLCILVSLAVACGRVESKTSWRILIGLLLGFYTALLLEAAGTETPGTTTVLFALSGVWGTTFPASVERRLAPRRLSSRTRRRILSLVPSVAVLSAVLLKEIVYAVSFYMIGVTLSSVHVMRIFFSSLLAFVVGLFGYPLLSAWVTRPHRKVKKR